jgi:histidine triad (HIT) family protein
MGDCVFCPIISREDQRELVREWPETVAFFPGGPGPCTPHGHLLVVPKAHVEHAGVDPAVTGLTFQRAAELANEVGAGAYHLIVNCGRAAGQSVFHLHIHIVFRVAGDNVVMPWDWQKAERPSGETVVKP